MELVNANDVSAKNFFSETTQGELVIAEIQTTTMKEEKSENDNVVAKKEEIENKKVIARTINYKSLISQYTTPMTFFIELGTVTRNPEFLEDVAKLVKKDAKIELTILDTVNKETSTQEEAYINHQILSNYTSQTPNPQGNQTRVKETISNETTTLVPNLKVTYVNTWTCEQSIIYNKQPSANEQTPQEVTNHEDEPKTSVPLENGQTLITWKTNWTTTTSTTTITDKYDNGTQSEYIDKTDEFIELLDKKYKIPNSNEKRTAGSYLKTGAEMLFGFLRQNPETQGLEQVMRYIMYKYTGKDYGVTEFPSGIYQIREFTQAGGTLKSLVRYWENGNGTPESSPDGKQYKVFDDGFGTATVGYGITIQWGYDRLVAKGYTGYSKEEILAKYKTEDIYIDVSIVDAVEDEIVAEKRALVQGLGLQLTTYQEYALVLRAYNYNLEGFVENYNKYWLPSDASNEKYFGKEVDYNHPLYTEYMSKPITSKGKTAPGLITRRKAEWALFSAGYFENTGKYWSDSGEGIAEFAMQFIGEDHSRFTSYKPSDGTQFSKASWCAMFVSYCFDQKGLIPSVLKETYTSCSIEVGKMRSRGEFMESLANGGNYTPQAGDIIFFTWHKGNVSDHTAIVTKCDGSTVWFVEGNGGPGTTFTRRVQEDSTSINSDTIVGYFPASQK